MKKTNFQDGTKTKNAVVIINAVEYQVTPAQYSGSTPLSAFNLNNMQNNIEQAINGINSIVELSTTIAANTNYIIPLNYHVNSNELTIFYCGEKLKKGTDYIEVGEAGALSNTVQFKEAIGNLDMSDVEGFENFKETLEFIVRGDYSAN